MNTNVATETTCLSFQSTVHAVDIVDIVDSAPAGGNDGTGGGVTNRVSKEWSYRSAHLLSGFKRLILTPVWHGGARRVLFWILAGGGETWTSAQLPKHPIFPVIWSVYNIFTAPLVIDHRGIFATECF